MNITNLWSVPIAECKILLDIQPALEYIKKLPFEKNDEVYCQYTVDKHLQDDTNLGKVAYEVKSYARTYAQDILGYHTEDPNYSIVLKSMWGIKMEPHNYASRHYHALSLFSGILYLNVDDNESNKIMFHTPRNNNTFVRIPISKWNTYNCYEYSVKPEPGKLILFPSDIDHSTTANMTDESLHCIAFDFSVKGTLGKDTTGELTLS